MKIEQTIETYYESLDDLIMAAHNFVKTTNIKIFKCDEPQKLILGFCCENYKNYFYCKWYYAVRGKFELYSHLKTENISDLEFINHEKTPKFMMFL